MDLDHTLASLAGNACEIAANVGKTGPLPVVESPRYAPNPDGGGTFSVEHVPDWEGIARRFVDVDVKSDSVGRAVVQELTARVRAIGTSSALRAAQAPDRVEAVLVAFITDVLTEIATSQSADLAIASAQRRLDRFLSGAPIHCELTTPLASVLLESNDVELVDGARIRHFTSADKDAFWRRHGITVRRAGGFEGLTRFDTVSAQTAIAVPVQVDAFSMLGWSAAQETEQQVVTALQVFGSRKPRSGVTYLSVREPLRAYRGLAGDDGIHTYYRPLGPSRTITVTPSTGAEMSEWLSWYRGHTLDGGIETAIRRLEQSDARPMPEDRLIDCWIALEALFLGPDEQVELNYRVSVRIAQFLGGTAPQRVALQRDMKRSYGMRSRVVHGSPPPSGSPKAAALDELLALTEDALGGVLRASRGITVGRKELLSALDQSLLTGARAPSWPRGS